MKKANRFSKLCTLSAVLAVPVISHAAVTQGSMLFNGGGVNHALTGTASQSTTDFGGDAARAIDGNTNGQWGGNSVTHSADGAPNSWQVDLGSVKPVNQVVIWNRTDCCGSRLSNFQLGVYDASNTQVWAQNYYTAGGSVGTNEVVNIPGGVNGQFVKVQQLGPNNDGNFFLSMAEVQVMQLNPVLFPNVAVGKPASQSSTAYGGDASRAVDGNTSGSYGANTVTHTADGSNGWVAGTPVWWEVDLQGDFQINEVAIFNRTDCCPDRLGNFRVSILNDGLEVWGADNFVGAAGSGLAMGSQWSNQENTGGFIATGDKVRISLIGNRNNSSDPNNAGTLSLAEVQVHGLAIPEPASVGLMALAGLALMRRRR